MSFPGHKVDMNFIRNNLASSLINFQINNSTSLKGAFNLLNPELTGRFMDSESVYCMSSLDQNTVSSLLMSRSDNNHNDVLGDEINQNFGNFLIKMHKIKLLLWNISLDISLLPKSVEKISLTYANNLTVLFTSEEIKSKIIKTIKIPAEHANLIGTIINLNFYDKYDSKLSQSVIDSKLFSCTLFKGNNIEKEKLNKFFDLSKEFLPIEIRYHNSNKSIYLIISLVAICISSIISIYIYIRKCRMRSSNSSSVMNYEKITLERGNTNSVNMSNNLK